MYSQQVKDSIDTKYLEDQIYVSFTYNLLFNKPKNIEQNGFSGGFSIGFIKDIPLNEKRNFGLGIGLGYSYNAYIQDLQIVNNNNTYTFSKAENIKTNRLSTFAIEMPIEFRFRNSTPTKYKFWRVYAGAKIAYLYSSRYKYSGQNEAYTIKKGKYLNDLEYGAMLNVGYDAWNLYVYYALNSLFKDSYIESEEIEMNAFNVGLKLYIM
ncbi:Outer membrane protein beta-barrel domain-containing protein [Lutibacter oricola]|uniref:Outer membrane protein beta-barrel domain-containing protein n=1 Tax=Lutibacter oricola TaxID=762486 RepID=A0A1H3DX88_9FLAO|nr:porin family protein [Lutibacter oricola]SDX71046.1 Outer membrane protein beta-barrel domain-containing protein [Lutibacter oricola]